MGQCRTKANIEGRVRREVRAMTRREVSLKVLARQLTRIQAAQVLGIAPCHLRRIRRYCQRWEISAGVNCGADDRAAGG